MSSALIDYLRQELRMMQILAWSYGTLSISTGSVCEINFHLLHLFRGLKTEFAVDLKRDVCIATRMTTRGQLHFLLVVSVSRTF
jgi:hypothetical protein